RQILEQMPIGVAIVEAPSGRPLFHNREAEFLTCRPLLLSDDYQGYAQYGGVRGDGRPYRSEEYPIARPLISGEGSKKGKKRNSRGKRTGTGFSADSPPVRDP